MSLRVRLVVALVFLSTASVVSVGFVSYAATSQRLHAEIDDSLDAYVDRLNDPDLRPVDLACGGAQRGEPDVGRTEPGEAELPQALVTCVDRQGRVLATNLSDAVGRRPATPIVITGDTRPITQQLDGRPARVLALRVADGRSVRVGRSLTETDRILDSLRNRLLALGLAVVAVAGLVGWLIARRAARPVAELTAAVEAVTASSALSVDVPVDDRGEVGRLARAFSDMVDRLRRSSDLQQQLVQDAGHELRTPLTSLRANVDTLRRHPELAGASRQELLTDLDGETRELTSLVDELVALASDRYDLEPEREVRVDELARRVADRTARRFERTIDVTTGPTVLLGQPDRLQRAIGNLLENAVKFSPDGSPVELSVTPDRVVVRDHGPGIAAADLPHVFDRFYRSVRVRDRPGSGLGLSIVEQVVSGSGGTITAANHPDGGACFTWVLQAGEPPADR